MPQLTKDECNALVSMMKQSKTPGQMLVSLQRARTRKGEAGPGKSAIYAFLSGQTHDGSENRGKTARLTAAMLKVFDQTRMKLIKAADGTCQVTWDMVVSAGVKQLRAQGLLGSRTPAWSVDWVARQMRTKLDTRSRPAKKRLIHSTKDKQKRYKKSLQWKKKRSCFWRAVGGVHSYVDTKAFVCARTAAQKEKMLQSRVTCHLRRPNEGRKPGFVAPKRNRMLIGIPSFDVTAAVAKDRIIMWRISSKPWNGSKAAETYKDLGRNLRRFWGNKRKFRVVEDGDPKGFQSGKGKAAKIEQKIESWQLPPRTPEWMPLDFCLWHEIEERLYKQKITHDESTETFQKRLERIAKTLPRSLVRDCLNSMHKRIRLTAQEKGGHIAVD